MIWKEETEPGARAKAVPVTVLVLRKRAAPSRPSLRRTTHKSTHDHRPCRHEAPWARGSLTASARLNTWCRLYTPRCPHAEGLHTVCIRSRPELAEAHLTLSTSTASSSLSPAILTTCREPYLVVHVCDVHAVEDVIAKVAAQHPPQDVEGDIGPRHGTRRCRRRHTPRPPAETQGEPSGREHCGARPAPHLGSRQRCGVGKPRHAEQNVCARPRMPATGLQGSELVARVYSTTFPSSTRITDGMKTFISKTGKEKPRTDFSFQISDLSGRAEIPERLRCSL